MSGNFRILRLCFAFLVLAGLQVVQSFVLLPSLENKNLVRFPAMTDKGGSRFLAQQRNYQGGLSPKLSSMCGRRDSSSEPEGVLPGGLSEPPGHLHLSTDSISLFGTKIEGGRHHQNTFRVCPLHRHVPGVGVQFNVEKVPEALPEHKAKPSVSRANLFKSLQGLAADYYDTTPIFDESDRAPTIRLEAVFEDDNETTDLVYIGGNGFLAASITAFAQHLPLQLSPDDVWAVISFAFAKHVDKHSEELRHNFVQFRGKKRLVVETSSDFQVSREGDPDSGASSSRWELEVFPGFSRQIKDYIGPSTHALLAAPYSTTTPTTQASAEIALMTAMKNYFSFGMLTDCGIPMITMTGTRDDWLSIRKRAEQLGDLMTEPFSQKWMPALLPVLDEFVASYDGKVNHSFWQTMVKLRNNGMVSGRCEYITGWIQILFPYLKNGKETLLRPWNDMYWTGPDAKDFPTIINSVPVDWKYHGKKMKLSFHAGSLGFRQDPADGTLIPTVGWFVSHDDPTRPLLLRDAEIAREIDDLLEGYQNEADGTHEELMSKMWYQHVQDLRDERKKIMSKLEEKLDEQESA